MPLIIINMGGEMMYILEQRLLAQAITRDKSRRVLQDVVRMMFNTKFVDELFKPQELYSNTSIRGIFDRLAHSSIMRLSESSMDKLFDLMTMGVKYQLVCSTYPAEMIDITLNHIDAMRMLVEDQSIETLIDTFLVRFKERYEALPIGEWMELRQTLHRYFQDRRIRVSLFMKENLQTPTGYIVFPTEEEVPPNFEVPGKIRTYLGTGVVESSFAYAGAAKARAPVAPGARPTRSKLGINLYSKGTSTHAQQHSDVSVSSPPSSPAPAGNPSSVTTPIAASKQTPAFTSISSPTYTESPSELQEQSVTPTGRIGAAELNLLATLVNPQISSSASGSDIVKVNLFSADKWGLFDMDNRADIIPSVTTITLDPTRKNAILEGLMSDLNVGGGDSSEQDLLDLMDSAT